MGAALGEEAVAEQLLRGLRARLDALRATVAGAVRRRVLLLEWTDPPFSAGHWTPELVTAAGGEALSRTLARTPSGSAGTLSP